MTLSQMISISLALDFNWPYELEAFYGFASNVAPTIVNEFSTNCLFNFLEFDSKTTYYINYLLSIIYPFVFWGVLVLIFAIRAFQKRNSAEPFPFKEMVLTTGLITFYLK